MKRHLIAALGVLVLVAATCADEPKAKPVAVPFELLKTKHMTVQIKVNGKGPYRVIFDTGAPVTVLNNKIAKESGLLRGAKKPAIGLFGGGGQATAETLQVGDLVARDVPVIVMDHPTVAAVSRVLGPIDGIVGFPFFARYRMTLDYQKQEMTFIPNSYDPPDVMQAMMAALLTLRDKPQGKDVLAPAAQWGMVVAKESNDDAAGVTIKEVLPGGAAAAAGLKAGDRLLTLDGRWTDTVHDAYRAAGHVKAGSAVPVTVQRDGKAVELTVKPAAGL
jgi:hypothetical protein